MFGWCSSVKRKIVLLYTKLLTTSDSVKVSLKEHNNLYSRYLAIYNSPKNNLDGLDEIRIF